MSTTITTPATVTTWSIDPAHTQVGFEVKHMMFAKVRGRFEQFEGSIELGEDNHVGAVRVEIDASSIHTGQKDRDEHLRSADFFDVASFPKLVFESVGEQRADGDDFTLPGTLTIRDVAKDVRLDVTETGRGTDPWGNERLGFSASATIDRRDFGLTWNQALEAGGILVGNEVRIVLEGQAVLESD